MLYKGLKMGEEERKEKTFFPKRIRIVIILFVFVTFLLPIFILIFAHLTNLEDPPAFLSVLLWTANLLFLIGFISIIIFSVAWKLKLIRAISFNPILKIILISLLFIYFISAMVVGISGIIGIVRILFLLR